MVGQLFCPLSGNVTLSSMNCTWSPGPHWLRQHSCIWFWRVTHRTSGYVCLLFLIDPKPLLLLPFLEAFLEAQDTGYTYLTPAPLCISVHSPAQYSVAILAFFRLLVLFPMLKNGCPSLSSNFSSFQKEFLRNPDFPHLVPTTICHFTFSIVNIYLVSSTFNSNYYANRWHIIN